MTAVEYLNRDNPLTEQAGEEVENPYSRDEWRIVECPNTGMVYLKNPPDYQAFEETFAWEKQYAEEKQRRQQEEPFLSSISELMKRLRSRYRKRETIEKEANRLLLELRQYNAHPRVVDVGCGIGTKLQRICAHMLSTFELQIEPVGIEISKQQAQQANEALNKVNGYCIQDSAIGGLTNIEPDSIDLLILCSFLEHEVNPTELLRQAKTKLKAHGQILIKVPNYDCKNRKIRQHKWCGFRYPDHVNYFTPDTLSRMLIKTGLTVCEHRAQPFNDNMWFVAACNR